MALITSDLMKLVHTGIDDVVKVQASEVKPAWERAVKKIDTDQGYYSVEQISGFHDFEQLAQGATASPDQKYPINLSNYYPYEWAKLIEFTYAAKEDDVYKEVAVFAQDFVIADTRTMNKQAAKLYNNGFDSNFPIWDTLPLFSSAHTGMPGVSWSNLVATQALGAISLETMLTNFWNQQDVNGELMEFDGGMDLIVGNALFPFAKRLVEAQGLAQTNNNDPNVAGEFLTLNRQNQITSTTAFFGKSNRDDEHGLRLIEFGDGYQYVANDDARTRSQIVSAFRRYGVFPFYAQGVVGCKGV